jgi:hypothetical protein
VADHPGTTGADNRSHQWAPGVLQHLDAEIRSHLGYHPDQNDHADMHALARRLGCSLPASYDRLRL